MKTKGPLIISVVAALAIFILAFAFGSVSTLRALAVAAAIAFVSFGWAVSD